MSAKAAQPAPAARISMRKTRIGIVVSNKMQKTITVRVDRLMSHAHFPRTIKRSETFKAHDEANTANIGDSVKIAETRPMSKEKRWRLVEVLKRASTAPPVPGGEDVAARSAARGTSSPAGKVPARSEASTPSAK